MRTLVFGVTGMLGQALRKTIRRRGNEFIGSAPCDSDYNIDFADGEAVDDVLNKIRPEIVINAAAITDCSACERDVGSAYRVNARPSSFIADWARRNDAYYVYISTDHFFTGDGDKLHDEDSPVVLLNEYARSKYLGEVLTQLHSESLVVRTNIVGFRGWSTPTFVEWAIASLKSKTNVTLFDDYYTSSIPVSLFSESLCDLIDRQPVGTINLAARHAVSKKDFVLALARKMNLPCDHVASGSIASLTTCRAESLGLDVSRAETLLGYTLPNLDDVIERLCLDYQENEQ